MKVSLGEGVKVLETAVGAVFAPTGSSLGRISIRTWLQTEILRKEVQGWGWESKFDPHETQVQSVPQIKFKVSNEAILCPIAPSFCPGMIPKYCP